jgi:ribosomal protein S18 acetylase RimI-like enzyme
MELEGIFAALWDVNLLKPLKTAKRQRCWSKINSMNRLVYGYLIRPLTGTSADLAGVLEVYRQCEDFLALGPEAKASAEMVQADLAISRAEGAVFHAIEDTANGKMAGILDYVLAGFEGNPELAFLGLLMIAAPYRGMGLGEAVVQALEEEIRQDGRARAIRSGGQVNNPGGIRFWRRMGFETTGGPEEMPDGTTVYHLLKQLP